MSVKISELTAADSVGNSDVLPIVQSGSTKKVAASVLLGGKQDILTAGTGIDITSNTISVDGGVIQTIDTDANIWELAEGIYKVTGEVKLYYMSGQYISISSGSVATLIVDISLGIKHYQLFYDVNITYGRSTSILGTKYKYETQNNKVTSISSSSTDTEYPSAKCVYDAIPNITYGTTDLTPRNKRACRWHILLCI